MEHLYYAWFCAFLAANSLFLLLFEELLRPGKSGIFNPLTVPSCESSGYTMLVLAECKSKSYQMGCLVMSILRGGGLLPLRASERGDWPS